MSSKSINKTILPILATVSLIVASGLVVLTRTNESTSVTTSSSQKQTHTSNYVTIKYRNGQVDVANPRFEYFNTSNSSFIRGAWYDISESYMVINLNGTNYHYCGMPSSIWQDFKSSSSAGKYYNGNIKGNYDCRENPVPNYE